MKKKLLTAVLSAVLCLGMSVTAMAATSPSAGIPSSADVTMGSVSSNFYENATDAQAEALDAYYEKIESMGNSEEAYKTVAAELIAATAGISAKVEFATIFDVSATDLSKPVRFEAPGISAGNSIVVLHLKSDGTWENIPAVAGNGYIDAAFTSLSPVMYARLASAADTTHNHSFAENVVAPTADTWGYTLYTCECGYSYADNYVAPTNGAAAVSPKTADSVMPVLVMMTAVAMLGIAVAVRRKEA